MAIFAPLLTEKKETALRPRYSHQRGSSLVLALFVILVLTLLGGVLMNIISTSSETVSQEVLGTRAYMAANSAMQAELQKLFPINDATGSCNAVNPFPYNLETAAGDDIPGLYDCSASVMCDRYHIDIGTGVQYFRLISTGKCGSSDMNAESKVVVKSSRTLQVEARSL